MAKRKGIRQQLSKLAASGQTLEEQVQQSIAQKKYAQAIRKLQQGLKRNPDQQLTVSEADIWLQQGHYEFERANYLQAEASFQKALDLGLRGDAHYWLAKSLLAQQKEAAALAVMQAAFEDKTLPKELGGCYLKLLLLDGKTEVVENLLEGQARRFHAPQLHWARGALALQAGEPEAALSHFQKMGRQASPGDWPVAWQVYAHQSAGDWPRAEKELSVAPPALGGRRMRPIRPQHVAVERLTIFQAAHTGRSLVGCLDLEKSALPERDAARVLEILHLVREGDFHDAAHRAQSLTDKVLARYPEMKLLYRPLMLLAGEQARQQQELQCAASFWGEVVGEPAYDPQIALHLCNALEQIGAHRQVQQQLHQLLRWVQREAKQKPEAWPEARLTPTLAKLHCLLADSQMSAGSYREAERSVQQAERLAPEHPDVIGRKGLEAYVRRQEKAAIPLLTRALEGGCRFEEVYQILLEALEIEGDGETAKTIRRKFGKHFGDTGVDTEVEIPVWVEALTFQNYAVMEEYVSEAKKPSPVLQALQIFTEAAEGEPSSGQKIALDREKAASQWDELLQAQSPGERVEVLKAIEWVIQQHAKRNRKGMAALQDKYRRKIAELASRQVPGADVALLASLGMRAPPREQLEESVAQVLSRATQPATILARAQLELRRLGPNQKLLPFIEAQLEREPEHPLLLLARATAYPRNSHAYQTSWERGFEIARRLQDAQALQAFREEEWFKAQAATRRAIGPQMNRLDELGELDMLDILQRLAREALGRDVPPEIIGQMIPELASQMAQGFAEEDWGDEFEPFPLPPPRQRRGKKSSKKRKPWYEL